MKRRDFVAGATMLPLLGREARGAGGVVDPGDFGDGVAGINRAIARLAARGGGEVRVGRDTRLTGAIEAGDGVTLTVPPGVTLTLARRARAMVDWGTAVRDFALGGGGVLDVAGLAVYSVLGTASRRPLLGDVRFVNWKRGPQFESGEGGPPEAVRVRGLTLGRPYVDPADPEGASEVGHGLRITCRPALGHAMIPWVDIDGLRIEEAPPGGFGPGNPHTADQLTLQGVVGGRVRNVVTAHGGEVGFSMSFGCRDIDVEAVVAACNDGNGIYVAGSRYRVDVAGATGSFGPGEAVTGGLSGATAVVEYRVGDVLWLKQPGRGKMRPGERILGSRSGAEAAVVQVHDARDIRIHDTCRGIGNGIDALGTGRRHAGLYVQHAERVGVGGVYAGNGAAGVKIGSSSWYRLGHLETSENPEPLVEVGGSVYLGARADGADGDAPRPPSPVGPACEGANR